MEISQIIGFIVIIIAITIMILTITIKREDNKSEKYEKNDNADDSLYRNDNQYYKLGNFFLREGSPNYEIYNSYKKDVNVQPIQFPAVDYVHPFDSGLKKSNTMVAIPQKNVTFVNLLNPVTSSF